MKNFLKKLNFSKPLVWYFLIIIGAIFIDSVIKASESSNFISKLHHVFFRNLQEFASLYIGLFLGILVGISLSKYTNKNWICWLFGIAVCLLTWSIPSIMKY